jgi:hypothetical protein
MAPQAVEISPSTPGNGAAPGASDKAPSAPLTAGMGIAQDNLESAPGKNAGSKAAEPCPADAAPTEAASAAREAGSPHMAPQASEIARSAPGNDGQDEPPADSGPPPRFDGPPCITTDGYIRVAGVVWKTIGGVAVM